MFSWSTPTHVQCTLCMFQVWTFVSMNFLKNGFILFLSLFKDLLDKKPLYGQSNRSTSISQHRLAADHNSESNGMFSYHFYHLLCVRRQKLAGNMDFSLPPFGCTFAEMEVFNVQVWGYLLCWLVFISFVFQLGWFIYTTTRLSLFNGLLIWWTLIPALKTLHVFRHGLTLIFPRTIYFFRKCFPNSSFRHFRVRVKIRFLKTLKPFLNFIATLFCLQGNVFKSVFWKNLIFL